MLFLKPKTSLGIDIGSGGMKLVELREEKERPVLHTYALTVEKQTIHKIQPVSDKTVGQLLNKQKPEEQKIENTDFSDQQVTEYSNTIKAVCRAAKVTSKSAIVSLPVSAVFHAVVTLPFVKKDELLHLVEAEVKKLLPIPLEQVAIDFQVISVDETAKTQRVLINAVPQKLISFYSEVFHAAKLGLDALEPESSALTRSLVGLDKSITMVVDIGHERTNFFIIDNGVPVTHQSIEIGGGKVDKVLQNILGLNDFKIVEQIKHDLFNNIQSINSQTLPESRFLEIFNHVIDPMMKEIEVRFELYLRQSGNEGKRPEKIILTGGMGFMPYLAKTISEKFKIKSYLGDAWARVVYQDGLKPILKEIGPRMSVAIGLALRNMV